MTKNNLGRNGETGGQRLRLALVPLLLWALLCVPTLPGAAHAPDDLDSSIDIGGTVTTEWDGVGRNLIADLALQPDGCPGHDALVRNHGR